MKSLAFRLVLTVLILPFGVARASDDVVIAQWGKEKILLYLPLYIAIEKGFFSDQDLNVSLRFVGNDDQVFASVISGDAAFGVGDPVFAAIAREKGFPGKVVALLVEKLGNSGFTKRADIPQITTPSRLVDYRIATYPAPSTTYTLVRQLLERERPGSSSQIVQSAIGAQVAALESASADIAVDIEPAVSIAESKGYRVVVSLDTFNPSLAITGLTTSDTFIQSHPDRVRKVVTALNQALQLIADKPDEAMAVAVSQFPRIDARLIQNAFTRMNELGVYPQQARMPEELWQRTLQIRLASGELKSQQKTEQSVDNSFADSVAATEEGAGNANGK